MRSHLTPGYLIGVKYEFEQVANTATDSDLIALLHRISEKIGALEEPTCLDEAVGWGMRFFTHDILALRGFRSIPGVEWLMDILLAIAHSLSMEQYSVRTNYQREFCSVRQPNER